MAATRPVVLVYQEFATLSSTPATPELNCLVAGPAYWIKDFPDNRADVKLAQTYGTLESANPYTAPVGGSDAITLTDAPANKVGAVLDRASVKVYLDKVRAEITKNGADGLPANGTTTASSPDLTVASGNFVTAGVKAGDIVVLTDSGGTPATIVRKVRTVSALTLTFTSEIPAAGFTAGATTKFRVERELTDKALDAAFVETVAGSNTIKVKGGATVAVDGVQKTVNYAEVYAAYRSLRQDLQDVTTLSAVSQIKGQLGAIDARNPLAAGAFVALQNTNTSIQVFGVSSDDLVGYTAMKGAISTRKDIYAVVPLTGDVAVLAVLKAEFEALADPNYALTNGVPQKFRVAIGSTGSLPTTKKVVDTQTDGKTEVNGAPTGGFHTLNLTGITSLITAGVLPGDKLTITLDSAGTGRNGTYTVAQVIDADSLEVLEAIPGGAQAGNLSAVIKVGSTAVDRIPVAALTGAATVTDAALYLDLYDANGTFVDSGVLPGDMIEMPKDTVSTSFASTDKWTIATVVSNQRLRIVNNGRNTALVAYELPHGVTRSAPTALVATTPTLTYRVVRTLDKDGQVTELQAIASSLASRRVVNVWPDKCDVAGLVDGSLPRAVADKPEVAGTQPGFYLACAVGGMTAGLPSHQGFTNLAIAGVSKIYNSNTYFDDKQLTKVSNGGWFAFFQETPGSLPYVVHQLTTDPSTLEFGEFSMVKNFDFVSMFFSDILDDFIGKWNINTETIGFINAALKSGIDSLKLRRRVRIGAPIIDANVTSLGESPVSSDRIEAYIEVDFPKPLNTVGLHLVSI
jgi:hypothetical protein